MCNGQFHSLFPYAKVTNTAHTKSDHRPILLDTEGDVIGDNFRAKIKQFEARWLKEDDVVHLVSEAWDRTNPN